jgi:hypothetical protein
MTIPRKVKYLTKGYQNTVNYSNLQGSIGFPKREKLTMETGHFQGSEIVAGQPAENYLLSAGQPGAGPAWENVCEGIGREGPQSGRFTRLCSHE